MVLNKKFKNGEESIPEEFVFIPLLNFIEREYFRENKEKKCYTNIFQYMENSLLNSKKNFGVFHSNIYKELETYTFPINFFRMDFFIEQYLL